MLSLFRALTERVKALFITTAALDFEAALLARDAERKAELLRQADRYDDEGMHGIAQRLRYDAEGLSLQRPLVSVLAPVDHLLGKDDGRTPLLPAPPSDESPDVVPMPSTRTNPKKKRR
jgi:hypothetical protein